MCDASSVAIGAVLGQQLGKESHMIHYVSRTLDNAQSNYLTTKKELLTVVFALEKFRYYLLSTKIGVYFDKIVVYYDHAVLKYLL